MSRVLLGNPTVVEHSRDPANDQIVRRERTDLQAQVTTVELPDGWGLSETMLAIERLWPWHSDSDGPDWVEADDPLVAEMISQRFTTDEHECVVGRPKRWNEGAR